MLLYGTDQLNENAQARSLLALAVQEQRPFSPLPEIQRHPLGKPFFPTLPQLEFNLSHSGRLALCGLDCQPLGVDIQIIKAWRPALPRRVCSEAELRWLEEQPDPTTGFSLLWSLKEARVKESGQGLRMPIREISVPLPPSWEAPVRLDALWFFTYQDTGWTAAVCGHTPPPPQIQWRSLNF